MDNQNIIQSIELDGKRQKIPWYELETEEEVDRNMVRIDMNRLESGQYKVRLPFFSELRPPNNFENALSQLNRLLKRLKATNMTERYEKN